MTRQDDLEKTHKALMRLGPVPDPDPLRRASARRLFLEQAARLRASAPTASPARRRPASRLFRLGAAALCAVSLALASLTGTALAADGAVPGDWLYPLDREIEELRLSLTADPARAVELMLAMADERLLEAEQLRADGDAQNMAAALDAYSQAVTSAAQAAAGLAGAEHAGLADLVEETLAIQEERLLDVRDRVPEQAQPGLDRAIDAARRGRRNRPTPQPSAEPSPTDDGPEGGRGPAEKTPGPPDDRPQGPPDDRGRPEKTKTPRK
jgi:hypothetical protein